MYNFPFEVERVEGKTEATTQTKGHEEGSRSRVRNIPEYQCSF